MARAPRNVSNFACDTKNVNAKTERGTDLVAAPKSLAWNLIVTGIVGWFAAFSLTLERLHVAADPGATLSCDVGVFVSCKSVMLTEQARLFGFPNPIIGLGAFVFPIAVGFAILAGARFAQWFWRTFFVGVSMGTLFVLWLFIQSTFVINVLCPYCMIAWAAMIPMFWALFLYLAREDVLELPVRFTPFFDRAYDRAWLFALATELLIAVVIAIRFWSQWPSLFDSLA